MKKTWIIVIIALLSISIIGGGYAVLDNIFPKAATINCPTEDSITSISLIQNNNVSLTVDATDFEEFLQNIRNAQPTRQMSVNDYPRVKTYYTIVVDTSVREYKYFIYIENSQVYIEIPYEGIYKANQQVLDFVVEYFKY